MKTTYRVIWTLLKLLGSMTAKRTLVIQQTYRIPQCSPPLRSSVWRWRLLAQLLSLQVPCQHILILLQTPIKKKLCWAADDTITNKLCWVLDLDYHICDVVEVASLCQSVLQFLDQCFFGNFLKNNHDLSIILSITLNV